MRVLLACLGMTAFLAVEAAPGDTIRFALPGWVELELVEVSGTSRLPLTYLYSGKDRDDLVEMSAPTYWIGKFEVSQKQYAAVMDETPSEAKDDRLPVTNVRWRDAVEFCDRLNQVVQGGVPPGYRFDLPTMVEWAHAFEGGETNAFRYSGSDDIDAVAWHGVGKGDTAVDYGSLHLPGLKSANAAKAYDMSGNVAEYVFIADAKGGNIRMGGSFMWPERYCGLCGTARVEKDAVSCDLGFRVALVPKAARDPGGMSCSMGTKGRVLLRSGCAMLARKYLSLALELDGLSVAETKALNEDWLKADKAFGYQIGDRHELMSAISNSIAGSGYEMGDLIRFWDRHALAEDALLRTRLIGFYRRHRVYAMMVDVKDLPQDVTRHFKSSLSKKVQAVSCDFTGDGLADLLVQLPGRSDANGDMYGFFERIREGDYRIVGEPIRNVGLCVLPGDDGAIGFVALIKLSDNTVAPGLLDCADVGGRKCLRIGWLLPRSYYLREFEDAAVHPEMPFMGRKNPARIKYLAEEGYQRTLCWPWKD